MIYFIEAVGADAVKVGYSLLDPWKRLLDFQVGCPLELRLLRVAAGDEAHEAALHKRWEAHWIRGEWFRLSAIEHEMSSIEPATLDPTLRRCSSCGAPLRSRHIERHHTGKCKPCALRGKRVNEVCARCLTENGPLKRLGGNNKGAVLLCMECRPIVKEERAQLRRYKQSQAMQGNQNAYKGVSARGRTLAVPKDRAH